MALDKHEQKGLTVGIDATNLRSGGGITHLIELLSAAQPEKQGVARVVVWGGADTLFKLPEQDWLEKVNPEALNRGLIRRTCWQRFSLSREAREGHCDVLFVPGGSYAGDFRPIVTMSRNLLPFEWSELLRYGWSFMTVKLLLLRLTQTRSYRVADGVIFLTEFARQTVLSVTQRYSGHAVTIPHGLNSRFQIAPKPQCQVERYTDSNPFRLLYVSIIDQYKHQWHVVEAAHILRGQGIPIVLDLVGPAYPPALTRFEAVVAKLDPERQWVHYHGVVPYESLHQIYASADLGVFASSCENMPNILLETMAAGLPIACSNRGPMPEVLGEAGLYFDPENPADIAKTLLEFISNPELRENKSKASAAAAKQFSWDRCAKETFSFLVEISRGKQK